MGSHVATRFQDYELSIDSGRKFKLDVSMFERLAAQQPPPAPVVTLSTQRRMHPSIAALVKQPALYPELRDAPGVAAYPPVLGMEQRLFFWNHSHAELGEEEVEGVAGGVLTGSKQNRGEAEMVVALAK